MDRDPVAILLLLLLRPDHAIFDHVDDIRSVIYPTDDRPLPLSAHATRGAYASRGQRDIAVSKDFPSFDTALNMCPNLAPFPSLDSNFRDACNDEQPVFYDA